MNQLGYCASMGDSSAGARKHLRRSVEANCRCTSRLLGQSALKMTSAAAKLQHTTL
jgi:hypothetical protein